ncbi:hypothetical protein ABT095_25030 [Kitasatospora sp. NPDC002227]|uniref:hypothetical protein n=1 Tax=Kitasatospora sp. NPDC002227 TaxID=3154773 RepID=UPI00331B2C74
MGLLSRRWGAAAVVAALLGLLLLLGAGPGLCLGHDGHGEVPVASVHCAPGEGTPAGCCAGPAAGDAVVVVSHARPEQPGAQPLAAAEAVASAAPEVRAADLPPPRPGGGRGMLASICVSRT